MATFGLTSPLTPSEDLSTSRSITTAHPMNAHQHTRFTSPFAPLQLSETDSKTLEQLSRVIVSNYVAQYEEFRLQGGAAGVDERVWKPVKQRENVRVFVRRKHQGAGDSVDALKRTLDRFSGSGAVQPSDLPMMLTVGSITGTLDDVMYGLMCPTVESMRVKTAYVEDRFVDTAVLQTIAAPTANDPFQSLVIKWSQAEQNILLRSVTSIRDFVYMERTGLAHTATGERLGFHLLHSVNFPQTNELPPFERGNYSICGVFRENPERNEVEMLVRSIVDPRGNAPRPFVIIAAADMFISVANYIECSHRKKLMWRLRMKRKESGGQWRGSKRRSSSADQLGPCSMCTRVPSRIMSALSDPHKHRCALCAKSVCSSCRIKKTLNHVPSATGKLWQREFAFCSACYLEVSQSDAFATALHEFVLSEATREGTIDESFSSREDFNSWSCPE